MAQTQFQRLVGQLPEWFQEQLTAPERFWIGEVPVTYDRNGRLAWTERAAHGGSVVFMTSGLFLLVDKVCRALVTGLTFTQQGRVIHFARRAQVGAAAVGRVSMARWLRAGGLAAALMGVGLAIPVVVAHAETRSPTGFALGLLLAAGVLAGSGVAAVAVGLWPKRGPSMPSGVRAAVLANIFLLGFCALELSDRLVRQQGHVLYWTTFLFPLPLVTFYGLVSARRWAWWLARGVTALAALWFLAWVPLVPFGDIRGEGGPAPWYARVYIICMCLAFAGVAAGAFRSLGRSGARSYFGFCKGQESVVVSHADGAAPN